MNDRLLRTQEVYEGGPAVPNPEEVRLRILANIWAVDKSAEEWAGPLDTSFCETSARYLWIRYEPGENCNILNNCGELPSGIYAAFDGFGLKYGWIVVCVQFASVVGCLLLPNSGFAHFRTRRDGR